MIEQIPQWMLDHEAKDAERFAQINQSLAGLATKEDIKLLATESSVRDIVHWQKNIISAGELLSNGGKWGYKAILVLATLLGAIAVITGSGKALLVWIFNKAV